MSSNTIPESVINGLIDALRSDNFEGVRLTLGQYPDLLHAKQPDSDNQSWLHIAARSCKREVVEFLIDSGLPVDILDGAAKTPLRIAASVISTEVVQLLLDRGADPNGCGGPSPLHAAVLSTTGCEPTLDALLRASPNLDTLDNAGCTPLMVACRQENFGGVKMLLAAGADVSVKHQQDGRTALDIARRRDFDEIVDYLEGYISVNRAQEAMDNIALDKDQFPRPL